MGGRAAKCAQLGGHMNYRLCRWAGLLGLASALALTGCSDDDGGGAGADTGAGAGTDGSEFYEGPNSAALGAAGNEADCALCHSADGTQEGFPGSTFQDIAYKTEYKGGDAPTLLMATNACVTGWMGGTALTGTEAEWVALKGYMESISDPAETTPNTLAPEVLADEAAYEAKYAAGGDATAGEATYNLNCGVCHNNSVQVGPIAAHGTAVLKGFTAGRIAQKVRTSGPPPSGMNDAADSTPGPMPFFEPSDLSDGDLMDIVAYLKQ